MSGAPAGMFLPKPKSGATSIDADGKIVHVEVREDEEQGRKLQEIIDSLLAAGYFRARIKGLSSFDKVVGGLVWCVENCSFDVDVDLLFQENLTIGQRIALTEKIVPVLLAMKCPHRIEPHQIQGLDCIHIFPVIQWLVKRSIETRQETGALIHSLAVAQFSRIFPSVTGQAERQKAQETLAHNYSQVMTSYGVTRKYRRRYAAPADEESQVESTLLEFGHMKPLNMALDYTEGGEEEKISEEQLEEERRREERKLAVLMQAMDITTSVENYRVAASVVGNIVSLRAEELAQAAEQYAEMKEEMQASPGGGEGSLARRRAVLTRKREALAEQVVKQEATNAELNVQLAQAEAKLELARSGQAKLQESLGMLHSLENAENKGLVQQLYSLVVLNESLKQQEAQFKQHCHSELSRLQALVAEAEHGPDPSLDDSSLSQQLEEEKEKLSRLRLQLAKRNRSIASLHRQIDEVPGRAELAQYQRRFLELYTQVSGKHKETKQYYTLYNTLHDTQLYLSKELSLLNSIQDNYAQAMSSSSSKEQFLQQFESIVQGIKHNKTKVETKRNDERARRERLSQGLLALIEQQRRYVAAVRQLTIECRNNEALLAQIRAADNKQ